MKFKIDRRRWLRGEGAENSRLLRVSDGKMCCLGQVALQCGVREHEIAWQETPDGIRPGSKNGMPEWIRYTTIDCEEAMSINDSKRRKPELREKALIKLFKKNGDALTFNH